MKRPWLWVVIVTNLVGLTVLAFVYPNAMLSPGPLVPAHAELAGNCFACHAPFRGVASDRCVRCHAVADIGVRTTTGAAVERPTGRAISAALHRELSEQNCSACHSDHGRLTARRFSHALLRPAARGACASCHTAPTNDLHRGLRVSCNRCHTTERWRPSSFDHGRFFVLDRHHNATCATCHVHNDLTRYTCFGCHEHTPANIRAGHEEEGVRNIDHCVSCHRSAAGEAGEHRQGRERGSRREDDEH